jgi:hypothetical protein
VIRGESEIITTGEDGKKALQVVLAAKQSYQNDGNPVSL